MSKTNQKIGTFLRIPLADGSFGYGRALEVPLFAFYDHRTTDPASDLDIIASKPVLFTLAVRRRPGRDKWEALGVKPLEGEVARPVVQYMQDLADFRKCVLFDTVGMRREVGPEECIGIEQAAVWEPHHVEERLLDKFMGRPNEEEISSRVRLS